MVLLLGGKGAIKLGQALLAVICADKLSRGDKLILMLLIILDEVSVQIL